MVSRAIKLIGKLEWFYSPGNILKDWVVGETIKYEPAVRRPEVLSAANAGLSLNQANCLKRY